LKFVFAVEVWAITSNSKYVPPLVTCALAKLKVIPSTALTGSVKLKIKTVWKPLQITLYKTLS